MVEVWCTWATVAPPGSIQPPPQQAESTFELSLHLVRPRNRPWIGLARGWESSAANTTPASRKLGRHGVGTGCRRRSLCRHRGACRTWKHCRTKSALRDTGGGSAGRSLAVERSVRLHRLMVHGLSSGGSGVPRRPGRRRASYSRPTEFYLKPGRASHATVCGCSEPHWRRC